MSADDTERLVEEALNAWRPRAPSGRILGHPAWADLPAPERERLFAETIQMRLFESALDPDGLSTTARAVLAKIG